ncbi:MAG: DUF3256 family protein [Muribaculaceae bacterium]|nr:DUF3256 family protein [Muribaculaceae bacterium]
MNLFKSHKRCGSHVSRGMITAALITLCLLLGSSRAQAIKPLEGLNHKLLELGILSPAISFFDVIGDNMDGVSDSTSLKVYVPELDITFTLSSNNPDAVNCMVDDTLEATFALLGKTGKEELVLAVYTPVQTQESLIEVYSPKDSRLTESGLKKIGIREPLLEDWLKQDMDSETLTEFTRVVPYIPYRALYNPHEKTLILQNGLERVMSGTDSFRDYLKPELRFLWTGKKFKAL